MPSAAREGDERILHALTDYAIALNDVRLGQYGAMVYLGHPVGSSVTEVPLASATQTWEPSSDVAHQLIRGSVDQGANLEHSDSRVSEYLGQNGRHASVARQEVRQQLGQGKVIAG